MVTLTSLGETALKEDKSVKLADIVMPERDIETFTEEIEKPDATFHVSIFENYETNWHPPVLWIGIGCERYTSKDLIANSLKKFFKSSNLSLHSIAGFATIDIKKDASLLRDNTNKGTSLPHWEPFPTGSGRSPVERCQHRISVIFKIKLLIN